VDFTLTQDFAAGLDTIDAALVDRSCLETMDQLPKIGSVEVLEQSRDGDTVRQRVRYQFMAELSGAVRRVIDPDKLTWVEDSVNNLAEHTATYRILPDNYTKLLEGSYDARLDAHGSGTRRTATGRLVVHVPLVGGKVERVIVAGLEENATAQGGLIDAWLATQPR